MNIIEIIDKKRRGLIHSPQEIYTLVQQMMLGEVPDYQLSAWLMAVCINGLNMEETTALTQAFVDSGTKLDWSAVDGVIVAPNPEAGCRARTRTTRTRPLKVDGAPRSPRRGDKA